ncbi:bifunctional alpha/beta hydrolase/OsmC family protein [Portibacter lacus]|uniref:Osmotically inducible protein C n=1 Tax=Portibacter lacus TaxID=1099794 RepID=A0AA37SRQ5_9BACT|nr:bifunctional alpha/beta hydrolase/OsmC family protein [Portibacter lacus]GLR18294.1 osmotically inducible protein C [Portibacter lacus]
MPSQKVSFLNANGKLLSGKLELPMIKKPYPYAIFAHVFTGNKNLKAARHISRALNLEGIAVLRFDFTGLGESEGDFSHTNFSTNVDDIKAAAKYLSENYESPSIIIGHSLGGAAALYAGAEMESVKAVATIGAPFQPEHVKNLIGDSIEEINEKGAAIISVDNREFTIRRQFIEDLSRKDTLEIIKDFDKALLILHSPQDRVVEIENAAQIYHAAKHPKSFVTLNGANHMLNNKSDSFYAGRVIGSWVQRYVTQKEEVKLTTTKQVMVKLENEGFTTEIMAGRHGLVADESENLGGNDFGPSPYELLNAALGACTAMTLQMYARRKKWPLETVNVHLSFDRKYADDCADCSNPKSKISHIDVCIALEGDLSDEQRTRLLEIADKCPVHKTLAENVSFNTYLE